MVRSLADLHALTCICGVSVALHRLPTGTQIACAEARDRSFREGGEQPFEATSGAGQADEMPRDDAGFPRDPFLHAGEV